MPSAANLLHEKKGLGKAVEPSLMGKSGANERNESSLSNCRVQPALSKKEGRVGFRKNTQNQKNRID